MVQPLSRRGFLAVVSLLPGVNPHWFARDEDAYLTCPPWPEPWRIMKPIKITDKELLGDISATCRALVDAEVKKSIDEDLIRTLQNGKM